MRGRKILTVDEEAVLAEAKSRAAGIIERAGIRLPERFNVVER